jgi:hypothetical protein
VTAEYSPEALRKQAEVDRLMDAGERVPLDLMFGLYEPATHATEAERCVCCQGDARPEWGGNGKHCQLCIGRGHDEDEETHDA